MGDLVWKEEEEEIISDEHGEWNKVHCSIWLLYQFACTIILIRNSLRTHATLECKDRDRLKNASPCELCYSIHPPICDAQPQI